MRRSALSRNHYFVLGLLIGFVLSFYVPQDIWELVQQEECPQVAAESSFIDKFGQDFEPHLNLINKPLAAKKPLKNVIRPRYYSSELGIREKIFFGVMTSQDNINNLATAINRTTAHLVNKIKFFINADNVKTNYKLKNIVGFTDTRENLRPFHVIKYIADNYLDDFDYFFIIPDNVYVDARKLKSLLNHMSITFDLYMGTRMDNKLNAYDDGSITNSNSAAVNANREHDIVNDEFRMLSDRNYCDLNAGILLSSSVIRKMRNNLDWCVRNGIANIHSVNIGRCVKYSSKLAGCQENFQEIQHRTYNLHPHVQIFKDLNSLSKDEAFRNATSVYPVSVTDDFYRLHGYFSKYHLELVEHRGYELEQKSLRIANGTISNNILEIRWPLGVPLGSAPETRHDILIWHLINRTHIYLPNAENVIEPLSHIDSLDFEKILQITIKYAEHKYVKLKYFDLHTVYRKYDPTRGMDYHLHLMFYKITKELNVKRHLIMKSFEIIKPLGRVEVVPSPYVTESTRIAILLPTFEHQLDDAIEFITQYERICMKNQDNTFLLMIFLYRYDSSSKGDNDPFKNVKTFALDLSTKYKTDGSRIAWVSIRLPNILNEPNLPDDLMLNSIYATNEILSIAVADLALPKIGLDSLVLMASTSITFKTDFLNRVRMNTIQGYQIFSPIAFMMFPCKFVNFCKVCDTCDVSQSTGYFDKWNYDVISFYSRDYVQARKLIESKLPIMHSDTDIERLLTITNKGINNIMDMFVASGLSIHILRGVEPNLRQGNALKKHFESSTEMPKCAAIQQNNDINTNLPGGIQTSVVTSADDIAADGVIAGGGGGGGGVAAVENDKSVNILNSYSNEIPLRYEHLRGKNINNLNRHKCVHLASRKQIGDAIIRYEDRSILVK